MKCLKYLHQSLRAQLSILRARRLHHPSHAPGGDVIAAAAAVPAAPAPPAGHRPRPRGIPAAFQRERPRPRASPGKAPTAPMYSRCSAEKRALRFKKCCFQYRILHLLKTV